MRGGLIIKDPTSFNKDVKDFGEKFEVYLPSITQEFIRTIQEERNEKLTIACPNFNSDPQLQLAGIDATTLKKKEVDFLFSLEQQLINTPIDLKTIKNYWYKGSKSDIFIECIHSYLDDNFEKTGKYSKGWFFTSKSNIFYCWRGPYNKILVAGYYILLQDKNLKDWFEEKWWDYLPYVNAPPTIADNAVWQTSGLLIPVLDFPRDSIVEIPQIVFENAFDGSNKSNEKKGLF